MARVTAGFVPANKQKSVTGAADGGQKYAGREVRGAWDIDNSFLVGLHPFAATVPRRLPWAPNGPSLNINLRISLAKRRKKAMF